MVDIQSIYQRLGSTLTEELIDLCGQQGIGLDSPDLQAFFDRIEVRDRLFGEHSQQLQQVLERQNQIQTQQICHAIAELLPSLKIDPSPVRPIAATGKSNPTPNAIALICGAIGAILGSGLTYYFATGWLLPQQLAANRLQNAAELKYLSSAEGRLFRDIVSENAGYLDSRKCQAEAKSQNLFLVRNGRKLYNVCVLLIPPKS